MEHPNQEYITFYLYINNYWICCR